MFEPTPIQSKLLKAVQNVATERHRLIGKSGTAGILDLTPGERAHLETVRRTGNELEALAAAVGVPQSVIDYTRAAGERGHGWRPGQPLLNTEVIDRDTVVAGHLRSVWQLQTMAGVGAAIAQQGTLPRDGFDAFRRVMGASWQRVGALGHALDLTQREREHAWEPSSRPWTERVAETVESMERSTLTARWRRIVETDFVAATIPVTVLTAAGVTPDDISRQLPVLPDRMVELAALALRPEPTVREVFGAGISAAIEVTGIDAHTEPESDDPTGLAADRGSDYDLGPDP